MDMKTRFATAASIGLTIGFLSGALFVQNTEDTRVPKNTVVSVQLSVDPSLQAYCDEFGDRDMYPLNYDVEKGVVVTVESCDGARALGLIK